MRWSARAMVGTVTLVVIAGTLLGVAALAVSGLGILRDADGSVPPHASTCTILRPDGVLPSQWFSPSGELVLSSEQVGTVALTLAMRAGLDDGDGDAHLLADLLNTYVRDVDRGRRPTAAERDALARLDDEVVSCPPA